MITRCIVLGEWSHLVYESFRVVHTSGLHTAQDVLTAQHQLKGYCLVLYRTDILHCIVLFVCLSLLTLLPADISKEQTVRTNLGYSRTILCQILERRDGVRPDESLEGRGGGREGDIN